jgi:hypothetical protein
MLKNTFPKTFFQNCLQDWIFNRLILERQIMRRETRNKTQQKAKNILSSKLFMNTNFVNIYTAEHLATGRNFSHPQNYCVCTPPKNCFCTVWMYISVQKYNFYPVQKRPSGGFLVLWGVCKVVFLATS